MAAKISSTGTHSKRAALQIHGCEKSALRAALCKGGRNTRKILILFNILLVESGGIENPAQLIEIKTLPE
jgi:hypothetical protein